VATLLEFDVEFEHAVLYRSLQFAFDDVNPAPALDLTAGSDLIKGNWQTHIGAMVGKETASARPLVATMIGTIELRLERTVFSATTCSHPTE
jgi:hypothetical protein